MSRESITYKGFEFEYTLAYSPAESEVRYYPDGSGYPGCAEEFEISNVTLNGIDAEELLEGQREEFDEFIINQLKDSQ